MATPTTLDAFSPFPARDGSDTVQIFGGEIDLRVEFDKFIRERGHKVLLRQALNQRCAAFSGEDFTIHPASCPHCWGGWGYRDIPVLTYCRPAYGPVAEGLVDELQSPFGELTVRQNLFYFKHSVAPSIRDGIIEVTLGEDTEPIQALQIEKVWDIEVTHPFRDQFGRIEYWIIAAQERKLGK